VDSFLRDISNKVGNPLFLSKEGLCAFHYSDMVVIVEVPQNTGYFFVYTSEVVPLMTSEHKDELLELNYLQQETRGGCLSAKKVANNGHEIVFSYMDRVSELRSEEFQNVLENYIDTAVKIRNVIRKKKPSPYSLAA